MQKPVELKDGELIVWAQLAPFGVFPGMRDGKVVPQVCDRAAFEQVIAAFKPEVLMDFEHRSENSDDTAASAWVQELRISDADGLEGLLRFTDDGAKAVISRRLRFPSPVWPLDGGNRPTYLKSVALTNTPNFDLRPVLNKAAGGEPQKGQAKMNKLAALYGLPETATEDDILAAAKAAQDKLTALETRVAEMDKAALKKEGEAVAEQNKAKVCNKAKFVELYVQNKAFALSLLDTVGQAAPVCNKKAAKNPADVFGQGDAVQNKLDQYSAMPEGTEKAKFLRDHAAEINDLRNAQASAE
jgi:phage I-like protein